MSSHRMDVIHQYKPCVHGTHGQSEKEREIQVVVEPKKGVPLFER